MAVAFTLALDGMLSTMRGMKDFQQSLTDDAFVQDPYPAYARARAIGPVCFWSDMGMVAAFDHQTVSQMLRDRRLGRTPLTPRPRPAHLEPFRAFEDNSLLELEPPRHTRLRSLVLRAFTSRRVTTLRADIEEITQTLITDFPADGSFDLIPIFCQQLPVRIIARLLGVPEDLSSDLLRWSTDMVAMYQTGVTDAVERKAGEATREFSDFMRGYVEQRRHRPADDLITELIAAEEDGTKLSTDEMIATCILLLNAGHEATVHSLGNGVRLLLETGHRPDPASIDACCEEILRFDAPLHVFTRFAYEDIALPGGQVLPRGDEIALVLGSANRDPDAYADADRFDPVRGASGHTSFGAGLHFCVGAPLARAEMQIALLALFQACPDLALAETPLYSNTYHFHKHDQLLVRI